eukprot:UN06692
MKTDKLRKLAMNKASPKEKLDGQLSPDQIVKDALPLINFDTPLKDLPWYNEKEKSNDIYDPAVLTKGDRTIQALVEMEAGIKISELNECLWKNGLALLNMGGASFQSIAGYICTSTHGSGISLGPVHDCARSMVVVSPSPWKGAQNQTEQSSYVYRIESKSNPLTDPEKWNNKEIELIQDDDLWKSLKCNNGSLGIIYSVVLVVMQRYWVRQKYDHVDFKKTHTGSRR